MTRATLRGALLLAAFATLAAGCKKEAGEVNEAPVQEGPIEVAPVPVEQDGVFRYADEIVTSGKAKTNALTQVHKGADTSSEAVTSLDSGVLVEKKARRGELVLVTWSATAGQPSFGWAPTASLTDEAAEPVVIPPTPVQDAGAADAAAKIADAGQADAAPIVDAGKADAKPVEDAGKADEASTDAGKADETKPASTTGDAGAGDGGPGLIRLPIKRNLPVLKLPGAAEKKP